MNPVPNRAPKKYEPVRNEELAKAMIELRKGSRTSPHEDSRSKRARTRKSAKTKAIKDSLND
jgi:hypothetical protein